MSQTKVQLIAPIGVVTASTLETTGVLTATTFVGDIAGTVTGITSTTDNLDVGILTATAFVGDFTGTASSIVTGSNVTAGIITGTKFVGNATGTVSGLADDTNINVGILTSTSFVGDLTGNAAGLSTTTANLSLGIVTATSFAGNITGNAAGISVTTTNANLGIITASAFHGDGTNLSGVSAGPVSQQAVTANGANTSIDLSSGNVIYMTQTADTTVAFASTEGNTDTVYLIRIPDGTARTLTWPSGLVWNGGSEPNLASGSDDFQVFKLTTRDNGATWYATLSSEDSPQRQLWVWGRNSYGSLGLNQTANNVRYSSPVQVPGTTWGPFTTNVSYGNESNVHNIKQDGTLWMWGRNNYGQLGLNSRTDYSSPVQVPGTTWSTLNRGNHRSAVIKTDSTAWVWGYNGYGDLGQNSRTDYSSPTQIPGSWSKIQIGAAGLGLKTDGTLWSWGRNYEGVLGLNQPAPDDGWTTISSPTQIPGTTWNDIELSYRSSYATKTDGTLWGWGSNVTGELGQNERTSRSSPVQIPGSWSGSKLRAHQYGLGAIKSDGTLWVWGMNSDGNLGLNDANRRSSPVQLPGTTWKELVWNSYGGAITTKTDGTMWIWGAYASQGQLGQNSTIQYSSPVQIPGTDWDTVSSFGYGSMAIKKVNPNP